MLHLAFAACDIPVVVDTQEIERGAATYTIDTLHTLRNELGTETSIAFLIGADQLQQLHTWKNWQQLFSYANFCVASRPGAALDSVALPLQLAEEIAQRRCGPEQIRSLPHGAICIDEGLAVDISATQIRNAMRHREPLNTWLPGPVLDYIKQHHLYQR
jgi:nicotinate-nucleotide adenylyltransferase